MPKFPDFQKLWDNYATGNPEEAGKLIGGAVGTGIGKLDAYGTPTGWIKNTCTIRLSRSFNYAGPEFRIPKAQTFPDGKHPTALNTVAGGDKLRYAYRVAEMLKYLRLKFGKPTVLVKRTPDGSIPPEFKNRKGIIVFNDCGWSDATGHVDLWNGTECRGHGYWDKAKEVYLWTDQARWTVTTALGGTLTEGTTPVVSVARR